MKKSLVPPVLCLLLLFGCGDKDKPTNPRDTTPPAYVGDFLAAALNGSSVRLTWSAPGDDGAEGTAAQYDIRYSSTRRTGSAWQTATPAPQPPTPHIAGTGESFIVNGLSGADTLFFAIRTADEVPNWSGWSNVTQTMLDGFPPGAIRDLRATEATPTSVTLSWTATGDDSSSGTASSYHIRYGYGWYTSWDRMMPVSDPPSPQAAGSTETFVVRGLAADAEFSFGVQVGDDAGHWSPPSNIALGRTADVTPPAAITDLAVTAIVFTSVTVRWTNTGDNGTNGGASLLDLRYSESPITEANWADARRVSLPPGVPPPGEITAFTVRGLEQERTYYFAVRSGDEVPNWSGLSNVVTATTPDQTTPSPVFDLVAGQPTTTTINLTWTAPGDDGGTGTAAQYDLRFSTTPIGTATWAAATPVPGIPAPLVAGTVQNFTVGGLLQGTIYFFALTAKDNQGNESGLSNVAICATLDSIPPGAIIDLAAVSATGSSVSLRWTAPGGDGSTGRAAAYDVRYSTAPIDEANWATADQVGGEPVPQPHGGIENFAVFGLQAGTHYYFAVKASDGANNWSPLSNVVAAATTEQTDQAAPAATTDLTIGQLGPTSVRLNWTAPGDDGTQGTASRYDVRYSAAPITEGSWTSAAVATGVPMPQPAGATEYLDIGNLQADTGYYFALKTADEVPNWSGLSNVPYGKTLDDVPPAAVTDLRVTGITTTTVGLRWTAPGDNGQSGTASFYDVRYATFAIDEGNWAAATPANGEPVPQVAGMQENFTVTGLELGTTYYLALKAADEVHQWGGLSNVALVTTSSYDPHPGGGPNAGGVLAVHATTLEYTVDVENYAGQSGVACGQDLPAPPAVNECPPYDPVDGAIPCNSMAANPTLATPPPGKSYVWYVMAAFPPGSCPRLRALAFRFDYDPAKVVITASGYDPDAFAMPFNSDLDNKAFPASGSGVGITFPFGARTSQLQEIYWFAGYSYEDATEATWRLRAKSGADNFFVNDSAPTRADVIHGFGVLGLGGTVGQDPWYCKELPWDCLQKGSGRK